MTSCLVTIANTDEMARSIDRYLRCFLEGRIDSFFMTYDRTLLSGPLFRQADLFVLELLRRDQLGYRAEAIPVATKWASAGKRVLVISTMAQGDVVDSPFFWDLASHDLLHERVKELLENPPLRPDLLRPLESAFKAYCRPAPSGHHSG